MSFNLFTRDSHCKKIEIMYVITRNMKVTKDLTESVIEDLSHKSAVVKAEGFIRRDIMVNKSSEDFDIIKMFIYWEDKESSIKWKGSKEHQQGHIERHKNRKESGKEPINKKALNLTTEEFEVVYTLLPE